MAWPSIQPAAVSSWNSLVLTWRRWEIETRGKRSSALYKLTFILEDLMSETTSALNMPHSCEAPRLSRLCVSVAVLLSLVMLCSGTHAATIALTVTDTSGKPVPDAVVSVSPQGGPQGTPSGEFTTPTHVVIDQRNLTFVPYVVAVRRGGTVTFQNSDQTRHQVYSFAPIKQFEFIVTPGETSPPVKFDTAGIAAIGCNIHDQMIAYVDVTDAPWVTITRDDGMARIDGLPSGTFMVTVWHPRLRPGAIAPSRSVTLPTQASNFSLSVAVLPPRIQADDMTMNPY